MKLKKISSKKTKKKADLSQRELTFKTHDCGHEVDTNSVEGKKKNNEAKF
jgi:hypothetical protein